MKKQFETPILMLIFNRPDTTQMVFNQIKKVKPKYLYISADGPRENNKDDENLCTQTREIIKQIDWGCEIKMNFIDKNLGCRLAPPTGITWFFSNVEQGIILEDDCLPDISFFYYCEELLNRYRKNKDIYMISGDNFLFNKIKIKESYYFTRLGHIWGWASWKRAWDHYDLEMKDFPTFKKENKIKKILNKRMHQNYFLTTFEEHYSDFPNTWDWQWVYNIWNNNGFCIAPSVNLISNIGFSSKATHTTDPKNKDANIPIGSLIFPLSHPIDIEINTLADAYEISHMSLLDFIIKLLKKLLKKMGLFRITKLFFKKIKKII